MDNVASLAWTQQVTHRTSESCRNRRFKLHVLRLTTLACTKKAKTKSRNFVENVRSENRIQYPLFLNILKQMRKTMRMELRKKDIRHKF